MIVRITRERRLRLDDADDFKRFKIVCELPGDAPMLQAALADFAEVETADKAWVDADALARLAGREHDDEWLCACRTMIEKARQYGWIKDAAQPRRTLIGAHVEWSA